MTPKQRSAKLDFKLVKVHGSHMMVSASDTICDRVRGNQAFGHAIHIRVRACVVGMVYFGEFWFFA